MVQPPDVVTQLAPQAQCVRAWGTSEKFDGAKGGNWIWEEILESDKSC